MNLKFLTSNDHKFNEMQSKLAQLDINFQHQKMSYPETQANSIEDVARYSLSLLIPVIEDNFLLEDAGLAIDGLNGFPGPYSSYVFRTLGWQGILSLMHNKKNRSAKFISMVGLYFNGETYLFRGECQGSIADQGSGEKGFGFDPIFIPQGYSETFAEMDIEEKNRISHRGKSVDKLLKFLDNNRS